MDEVYKSKQLDNTLAEMIEPARMNPLKWATTRHPVSHSAFCSLRTSAPTGQVFTQDWQSSQVGMVAQFAA